MEKEINYEAVIKRAAKEAVKEYKESEKVENKENLLHNTRLLMTYYNDLKIHAEKGIDSLKFAINGGDYGSLTADEIYILSIKQSKARTLIMIAHIDLALKELKKKQLREGCVEKYFALEMYFLKKLRYEDIQEKLNCSKNTPARWVTEMVQELSLLLFGLEGFKNILG